MGEEQKQLYNGLKDYYPELIGDMSEDDFASVISTRRGLGEVYDTMIQIDPNAAEQGTRMDFVNKYYTSPESEGRFFDLGALNGTPVGNFIDNVGREVAKGQKQGASVNEALEVMLKGAASSDIDLQEYVSAIGEYSNVEASPQMQRFIDAGGFTTKEGWSRFVTSSGNILPQLIGNSAAMMYGNTTTGSIILAGTAAAPFTGGTSVPVAAGLASGVLSAGLEFNGYIQEELAARGLELNEKNVRTLLDDKEFLKEVRRKAGSKGTVIGIIDGLSGGLSSGLSGKAARLAKAGNKKAATVKGLQAAAVEYSAGGVGELGAQLVAGEPLDATEIGLEVVAEIGQGVPNLLMPVIKEMYGTNEENTESNQPDDGGGDDNESEQITNETSEDEDGRNSPGPVGSDIQGDGSNSVETTEGLVPEDRDGPADVPNDDNIVDDQEGNTEDNAEDVDSEEEFRIDDNESLPETRLSASSENLEEGEVPVESAPEGNYVNIGLKAGKTDENISRTDIENSLPEDVSIEEYSEVEGTEPTASIKLSRKLTDGEMDILLEGTKQEAIPQLSDKKGKVHGSKDWGEFNPEYFIDIEGNPIVKSKEGNNSNETKSDNEITSYDFDDTLVDSKTGELTELGKEVKGRISNGEDITIISARENTDNNKDYIADKLDISKDKINLVGKNGDKGKVLDSLGIPRDKFFDSDSEKLSDVRLINSVNPTGGVFEEYNPKERATLPLADNITTYDKTANIDPDEKVTVYRGVPSGVNEINDGDFVTTNKQLAQDYAGDGKVISKEVKASQILDDKTEPLGEEYIYRENIDKSTDTQQESSKTPESAPVSESKTTTDIKFEGKNKVTVNGKEYKVNRNSEGEISSLSPVKGKGKRVTDVKTIDSVNSKEKKLERERIKYKLNSAEKQAEKVRDKTKSIISMAANLMKRFGTKVRVVTKDQLVKEINEKTGLSLSWIGTTIPPVNENNLNTSGRELHSFLRSIKYNLLQDRNQEEDVVINTISGIVSVKDINNMPVEDIRNNLYEVYGVSNITDLKKKINADISEYALRDKKSAIRSIIRSIRNIDLKKKWNSIFRFSNEEVGIEEVSDEEMNIIISLIKKADKETQPSYMDELGGIIFYHRRSDLSKMFDVINSDEILSDIGNRIRMISTLLIYGSDTSLTKLSDKAISAILNEERVKPTDGLIKELIFRNIKLTDNQIVNILNKHYKASDRYLFNTIYRLTNGGLLSDSVKNLLSDKALKEYNQIYVEKVESLKNELKNVQNEETFNFGDSIDNLFFLNGYANLILDGKIKNPNNLITLSPYIDLVKSKLFGKLTDEFLNSIPDTNKKIKFYKTFGTKEQKIKFTKESGKSIMDNLHLYELSTYEFLYENLDAKGRGEFTNSIVRKFKGGDGDIDIALDFMGYLPYDRRYEVIKSIDPYYYDSIFAEGSLYSNLSDSEKERLVLDFKEHIDFRAASSVSDFYANIYIEDFINGLKSDLNFDSKPHFPRIKDLEIEGLSVRHFFPLYTSFSTSDILRHWIDSWGSKLSTLESSTSNFDTNKRTNLHGYVEYNENAAVVGYSTSDNMSRRSEKTNRLKNLKVTRGKLNDTKPTIEESYKNKRDNHKYDEWFIQHSPLSVKTLVFYTDRFDGVKHLANDINRLFGIEVRLENKETGESKVILEGRKPNKIAVLGLKDGEGYGFFDRDRGEAVLREDAPVETSVHEMFTHPFLDLIKNTNKDLYNNLLEEAKKLKELKERVDKDYAWETQDGKNDEYIAAAIDMYLAGELDRVKDKNLIDYITEFFYQMSNALKEILNVPVNSTDISPNITLKELAQYVIHGEGVIKDLNSPEAITGFKQNKGKVSLSFIGDKGARNMANTPFVNDSLNKAALMEDRGASVEEIKKETGWERGLDKEWRLELDTSKAKLKASLTKIFDNDVMELQDILHFPEIYKAFPELKFVKVHSLGRRSEGYVAGSFSFDEKLSISLSPVTIDMGKVYESIDPNLRDVMVTASQASNYRINGIMNFLDYLNRIPNEFNENKDFLYDSLYNIVGNQGLKDSLTFLTYTDLIEITNEKPSNNKIIPPELLYDLIAEEIYIKENPNRIHLLEEVLDSFRSENNIEAVDKNEVVSTLLHEIQHFIQYKEGFPIGSSQLTAFFTVQLDSKLKSKYDAIKNDITRPLENRLEEAIDMVFEVYRGTLGEVEARLVQERINSDKFSEPAFYDKANEEFYKAPQNKQILEIVENSVFDSFDSEVVNLDLESITLNERTEIVQDSNRSNTLLKTPEGTDSNLTPSQWIDVRTVEFLNTFGDWINSKSSASKVISNSEPQIAYFDKISKSGIELTTDNKKARIHKTKDGNSSKVGVFVNMSNPSTDINSDTNTNDGYQNEDRIIVKEPSQIIIPSDTNVVASQIIEEKVNGAIRFSKSKSNKGKSKIKDVVGKIVERLKTTGLAAKVEFLTNDQIIEKLKSLGYNFGQARLEDGKLIVNGFVHGDTIYLNTDTMGLDTTIHEFAHLFNTWLRENNPEFYEQGIELVRREVKNLPNSPFAEIITSIMESQPDLDGEALYEEILTELIGQRGVDLLKEESISGGLMDWITRALTMISEALGISDKSLGDVLNMTLDEYTRNVAAELLKGENIKSKKYDYNSATTVNGKTVLNIVDDEKQTSFTLRKRHVDKAARLLGIYDNPYTATTVKEIVESAIEKGLHLAKTAMQNAESYIAMFDMGTVAIGVGPTPEELVGMGYHFNNLKNSREELSQKISDYLFDNYNGSTTNAFKAKDEIYLDMLSDLESIDNDIRTMSQALSMARSQAGLHLGFIKHLDRFVNYDVDAEIEKVRNKIGNKLTPAKERKLREELESYNQIMKRLTQLEAANSENKKERYTKLGNDTLQKEKSKTNDKNRDLNKWANKLREARPSNSKEVKEWYTDLRKFLLYLARSQNVYKINELFPIANSLLKGVVDDDTMLTALIGIIDADMKKGLEKSAQSQASIMKEEYTLLGRIRDIISKDLGEYKNKGKKPKPKRIRELQDLINKLKTLSLGSRTLSEEEFLDIFNRIETLENMYLNVLFRDKVFSNINKSDIESAINNLRALLIKKKELMSASSLSKKLDTLLSDSVELSRATLSSKTLASIKTVRKELTKLSRANSVTKDQIADVTAKINEILSDKGFPETTESDIKKIVAKLQKSYDSANENKEIRDLSNLLLNTTLSISIDPRDRTELAEEVRSVKNILKKMAKTPGVIDRGQVMLVLDKLKSIHEQKKLSEDIEFTEDYVSTAVESIRQLQVARQLESLKRINERLDDQIRRINEEDPTILKELAAPPGKSYSTPEMIRLRRAKLAKENDIRNYKARLGYTNAAKVLLDVLDIWKTLVLSADLSATGIQSFDLNLSNPIRAAKILGGSIKSGATHIVGKTIGDSIGVDPEFYDNYMNSLYHDDVYILSQSLDNPLRIIDDTGGFYLGSEELSSTKFLKRFKLTKGIVGFSEKALLYTINRSRFEAFKQYVKENPGASKEEYSEYAHYINTMSGGMKLKPQMERALPLFGVVFNATRMYLSFFAGAFRKLFLWDAAIYAHKKYKGDPTADVHGRIMVDMLKKHLALSMVYGLFMALGAEVDDDPLSSNFMRLRYRNLIFAPHPFIQYLNFMEKVFIRIAMMSEVGANALLATGVGIDQKRANTFKNKTFPEALGQFAAYKITPGVSLFAYPILSGETAIGEPITGRTLGESALTVAKQAFPTPIPLQQIFDSWAPIDMMYDEQAKKDFEISYGQKGLLFIGNSTGLSISARDDGFAHAEINEYMSKNDLRPKAYNSGYDKEDYPWLASKTGNTMVANPYAYYFKKDFRQTLASQMMEKLRNEEWVMNPDESQLKLQEDQTNQMACEIRAKLANEYMERFELEGPTAKCNRSKGSSKRGKSSNSRGSKGGGSNRGKR